MKCLRNAELIVFETGAGACLQKFIIASRCLLLQGLDASLSLASDLHT